MEGMFGLILFVIIAIVSMVNKIREASGKDDEMSKPQNYPRLEDLPEPIREMIIGQRQVRTARPVPPPPGEEMESDEGPTRPVQVQIKQAVSQVRPPSAAPGQMRQMPPSPPVRTAQPQQVRTAQPVGVPQQRLAPQQQRPRQAPQQPPPAPQQRRAAPQQQPRPQPQQQPRPSAPRPQQAQAQAATRSDAGTRATAQQQVQQQMQQQRRAARVQVPAPAPATRLPLPLRNIQQLRHAVILSEILAPPVSMR